MSTSEDIKDQLAIARSHLESLEAKAEKDELGDFFVKPIEAHVQELSKELSVADNEIVNHSFLFQSISHRIAENQGIGSGAEPQKIGILSAVVTCSCEHTWKAHSGSDLVSSFDNTVVTCPNCGRSSSVPNFYLGLNKLNYADLLSPLYKDALKVMADAFLKIRYLSLRPQTDEQKQFVYEVSNALHNLPDMLAGKCEFDEHYVRQQIALCNKLVHDQGPW